MKIIKVSDEWHEPTFKNVKVKCSGCDSELEIESEDVMESNGVAFFECPVCFKQNKMVNDVSLDSHQDVGAMYWNWKNYMDKKKSKALAYAKNWENERVKKSIMSDIERELDRAFQEDDVIMKGKSLEEITEGLIGLEYGMK